MSDDSESVVRRKVVSARATNAPVSRLNLVLSELSKQVEQDARAYLGAVVEAMIMDVETKSFSDVLDAISMPAMIAIVEVEGVDRSALIDIELDLLQHVVDLRMGGSASELPEFAARRPTPIDSVLCAPLIDIVLDAFGAGLKASYGSETAPKLTCSTFEHLPMSANIAPERADVLCVTVSLDIGEAARSGNFTMVLPFATLDVLKAQLKRSGGVAADSSRDAWAGHMLDAVLETEAEITPVIHTQLASVAELSRLEVGAVLPLDDDAHHNVALQIEVLGEPMEIAKARLGTLKSQKALKLAAAPDPAFLAPLRSFADAARP